MDREARDVRNVLLTQLVLDEIAHRPWFIVDGDFEVRFSPVLAILPLVNAFRLRVDVTAGKEQILGWRREVHELHAVFMIRRAGCELIDTVTDLGGNLVEERACRVDALLVTVGDVAILVVRRAADLAELLSLAARAPPSDVVAMALTLVLLLQSVLMCSGLKDD